MPIRNPFARRPANTTGSEPGLDENNQLSAQNSATGSETADGTGLKTSAVNIGGGKSQEPAEYKLSVVNDSGVYLPPSPPEAKGFWPRRSNQSSTSTNTTSSLAEFEPFSISRESFDSYRRSFDISAKSPVIVNENCNGRQSLDSARIPRLPRSAIAERRFERHPPTAEEGFEDVGLNDDQNKSQKKKGFFSKFGESMETNTTSTTSSKFHITGRKCGQSGQGAELGNIERQEVSGSKEVGEVR